MPEESLDQGPSENSSGDPACGNNQYNYMSLLFIHGKLIQPVFQLILNEYNRVQGHTLDAVVDVLILHCPIVTISYM